MENKLRTEKKLISNVFASGVFQLLFLITPLLTTPYITRIFSPTQIGIFGTSYASIMFIIQLAHFGLPIYGVRVIAQSKNISKSFFELFSIQVVSCLIFFILFNVFNVIFIKNNKIYFLQSFLILTTIFDISWFFVGIEEIKKNLLRNLFSKVIVIILIFLCIKTPSDFNFYIIINIIGILLGNLTMFFQLHRYIDWGNINFSLKKLHIVKAFGLLIPQSIDSGKNALSRILLVMLSNYRQAGLLDQGLKIISILSGIISSMSGALTPRVAYLIDIGDFLKVKKIINDFLVTILIFSLIIISGIIATAKNFTILFFGKSFIAVSDIMIIASFSILFGTISLFLGKSIMIPLSRDSIYRKQSIWSAGLLLLFNILLDPFFGAMGAAIALDLSSFILCILNLINLKEIIDIKKQAINIFFVLVGIFISTCVVLVINIENFTINNFWQFILNGSISLSISVLFSVSFIKIKKFNFKFR